MPIQNDTDTYRIQAFDRVIKHIEENLQQDISLDTLSNISNTSKFHFHRLFKEFFGESLSDYIKRRRLSYAAFQLVDTNRKIEDIAFEMNYNSIGSFTRAFTKHFKIPPAGYRKENIYWAPQLTPALNVNLYADTSPEFNETSFLETKLIGYTTKGSHTAKSIETDEGAIEKYWNFFGILSEHNYPVKDARLYSTSKTLSIREDSKEVYFREYETFTGVAVVDDTVLPGLEQLCLQKCDCLYHRFKGSNAEWEKYLGHLYLTLLPELPYDVNYELNFGYIHMGLHGEFLNDSGLLDYERYFDYCTPYEHNKMYYNSPDHITHFFLPYFNKKDIPRG